MTSAGDAAAQIEDMIAERMWPAEAVLGPRPEFDAIRGYAAGAARTMVAQLRGGDDKLAAQTAIDLAALLPDRIPDDWWRTPLGRLVAQSVGHPSAESVSFSVAAAMLGISKGRVQQLVTAGRLDRHPDGGITSVSVAMRAREAA